MTVVNDLDMHAPDQAALGLADASLRMATLEDGTKVMSVIDVMCYITKQSSDACRANWSNYTSLEAIRPLTTSYQFPGRAKTTLRWPQAMSSSI